MDRQHLFFSFVVTMITMVVILIIAAVLAYHGKYAEALGIGGVLTGMVAIATQLVRTSPPPGDAQSDRNLATALDKLPPATTGTGPATPINPEGPQ